MTRRLTSTLLTAAAAVAIPALLTASPATAQSVTRPAQDIALSIGRGQLMTVPGRMADVFIADEKVADVQVKSTNQLYLMGKEAGVTTVYASDAGGNVIWSANVRVGSNIDSVDQMLNVAMPDAKVAVSTFGSSTVLLTGTIAAPEDAAEAQRLVEAFMGKETNVISRLRMATPLQVNLQVRIAEVSRSLVKSLGTNLITTDPTSGFKFGLGQGRAFSPQYSPGGELGVGVTTGPAGATVVKTIEGSSTLAGAGKLFGLNLRGALDAGETAGLVTTLAQPNLTAISGETADFLAGGEFPIPQSQGLGTTSIEYKKYGVSLSYTPTVLSNGRISLRVRPEVSELSSQGAVTINGFTVPALTTRRAETTVELGSGQSFMIAGLLKNSTSNSVTKLPGAGDVPILGSLFRSTSFQRGETELVIVVTPYLVNPVDANAIKLPTDGYQAPNDIQRIFGNQESAGKTGGDRPKPSQAPASQQATPPAPSVGAADPAAPAPALASKDGGELPARSAKADPNAHPGFSLK
ncbi:MAG: type II and III secretion system protein family protein [Sphingomonadales bacterium]|nr:type II and III secretion system protein family protein [Sphingomonadales bacterium]